MRRPVLRFPTNLVQMDTQKLKRVRSQNRGSHEVTTIEQKNQKKLCLKLKSKSQIFITKKDIKTLSKLFKKNRKTNKTITTKVMTTVFLKQNHFSQ